MKDDRNESTVEEVMKKLDDILYETRIAISMMVLICFLNLMMVGTAIMAWIVFGERLAK